MLGAMLRASLSIAPSIIEHSFCVFFAAPPCLCRFFCLIRPFLSKCGIGIMFLPIMDKQPALGRINQA